MKILKYILSTAAAILLFSSCSDDSADLFLDNLPATITMKVGESISLAGDYSGNQDDQVVFPAGGDDFSYQTSTNGIVDVTQRGIVIPRKVGNTTILVKEKDTNQTVRTIAVEVLPTLTLSLKLGDVVSLKDLLPADDLKGIGAYEFNSTNENIADINSKFEIKTKSPGTTSIYYKGYFDPYTQQYKIKAIWIDITVE